MSRSHGMNRILEKDAAHTRCRSSFRILLTGNQSFLHRHFLRLVVSWVVYPPYDVWPHYFMRSCTRTVMFWADHASNGIIYVPPPEAKKTAANAITKYTSPLTVHCINETLTGLLVSNKRSKTNVSPPSSHCKYSKNCFEPTTGNFFSFALVFLDNDESE